MISIEVILFYYLTLFVLCSTYKCLLKVSSYFLIKKTFFLQELKFNITRKVIWIHIRKKKIYKLRIDDLSSKDGFWKRFQCIINFLMVEMNFLYYILNGQRTIQNVYNIWLIQATCIVKLEAKVWSSDGTIVGFSFEGIVIMGFNITYKMFDEFCLEALFSSMSFFICEHNCICANEKQIVKKKCIQVWQKFSVRICLLFANRQNCLKSWNVLEMNF